MTPRLDIAKAAPRLLQALLDMNNKVNSAGLEKSLMELVKTRASQINGCANCLHMHARDALANGETPERLVLLDAWREAPCYSDRERAALAWTDALTRVADTHASNEDFATMKAQFSDEEQVMLTLLITTINTWNRIAIGFRIVPEMEDRHDSQR